MLLCYKQTFIVMILLSYYNLFSKNCISDKTNSLESFSRPNSLLQAVWYSSPNFPPILLLLWLTISMCHHGVFRGLATPPWPSCSGWTFTTASSSPGLSSILFQPSPVSLTFPGDIAVKIFGWQKIFRWINESSGNDWNTENCNEGNTTMEESKQSRTNTSKTPVEEYWE